MLKLYLINISCRNWWSQEESYPLVANAWPTTLHSTKLRSTIQLLSWMVMRWPEFSGSSLKMNWFIPILISTSNILIWVSNIEIRLMIKSLLMQLKPSRNVRLELNVQLLLQMRLELKNSNWRKCGKVPMVPSEITLMEQFLESQS